MWVAKLPEVVSQLCNAIAAILHAVPALSQTRPTSNLRNFQHETLSSIPLFGNIELVSLLSTMQLAQLVFCMIGVVLYMQVCCIYIYAVYCNDYYYFWD